MKLNKKIRTTVAAFLATVTLSSSIIINPSTIGAAKYEKPVMVAKTTKDNKKSSKTKVLGAPYISQGTTMLCEGTSLLEALHYTGVTQENIASFVKTMPRTDDGNPYHGFSGDWEKAGGDVYQGMMAKPLVKWAHKENAQAKQIKGPKAIKKSINRNRPVVAWVTMDYAKPKYEKLSWGTAVINTHVVLVDGYSPEGYHIVDPNKGKYWVTTKQFEESNSNTGQAVSVGGKIDKNK